MKTPENINELIAKFFAGEEMTSLEKEQFQEWKKENNAEYSKLAGLINSLIAQNRSLMSTLLWPGSG